MYEMVIFCLKFHRNSGFGRDDDGESVGIDPSGGGKAAHGGCAAHAGRAAPGTGAANREAYAHQPRKLHQADAAP